MNALLFLCFVVSAVAHNFGLAPFYYTIEMLWIQDFSSSFADDRENVRSQFGDLVEELKWLFPHSRFGLAGFTDKPYGSFGYNESSDYCYQLRYKLTRYTGRLRDSLKKAQIHSGNDWPESQLHALLAGALSEQTKWSDHETTPNGYVIKRIITVVTDSGFHVAGDSDLPANNGDAEVDCLGEDYPSVTQVKNALATRDITPVFLVTKDVIPLYRKLVHDLGDSGAVWEIASDSSNLRVAMSAAINAIIGDKCGEGRCDGGCVGDNCCNGVPCGDEALLVHFKEMPQGLKILTNGDASNN